MPKEKAPEQKKLTPQELRAKAEDDFRKSEADKEAKRLADMKTRLEREQKENTARRDHEKRAQAEKTAKADKAAQEREAK